ncbi:hypothetical protein FOA52_010692 [Chlamydomonas sp. UWO 241]|nr:hypothetical protein FOA52_010692 [Chlamydomonas sp. UWO 241]
MVCPICIGTAIVANAPILAASLSGFAAAKLALGGRHVVCEKQAAVSSSLNAKAAPVLVAVDRPVAAPEVGGGQWWAPVTPGDRAFGFWHEDDA